MKSRKNTPSRKKVYSVLLLKAYLDKGLGLTNYLKWIFAFAGIFDFIDGKTAILVGASYVIFCFILGLAWYKFNLTEQENQVNNDFNPFVQAMLKATSKS
jgi:hypothetical protein